MRYPWLAAAAVTALAAVGVAAAAPPAYERSQQRIVVEGRAVAALVQAGDAGSIFGRRTDGRRVVRGTPVQGQFIEREGS